jgi:DNA polymerase-4
LLQKAAMRLRHEGFFAGGLQVTVKWRDGGQWSDDRGFNETQDTLHFTRVLNTMWAARPARWRGGAPQQVGIMLHRLLPGADHTADLFTADQEKTRTKLLHAVDRLNRTFGKNSVYFGGAHGSTDYAPMRIAFTRIPEPELEEIDRSLGRRLHPDQPPPTAEPGA